MKWVLLFGYLLLSAGVGGSAARGAPPSAGSQLPPENNGCALCHAEARLWQGEQQRLYVPAESRAADVHDLKGVNCHDCHGGDPTTLDIDQAHARTVPAATRWQAFRPLAEGTQKVCADCHQQEALQVLKSVHAHADRQRQGDFGQPLQCVSCHGEKAHGMLPVSDPRSPVYLDHQVATCGGCHEEDFRTYRETVHGCGLLDSGLVIAAACANCHGAHGIYYAADERSTLHKANVGQTCGTCHQGIGELLAASVHGQELAHPEGGPPPGEKWRRNPTCTDCHQGHRLQEPTSPEFRAQVKNFCGNCHPEHTGRYAMSTHGELTELGYAAAAKCSDCHGAHAICPLDDPASPLAPGANRLATCRQCHLHAVANFSQFSPHADHKNRARYPLLYAVYSSTHWLFMAFLVFFIVHAFAWFVRSFVTVLAGGRHRPLGQSEFMLVRYQPISRVLYLTLLITFLGLTLTGLPLKYSTQPWAKQTVRALGGFESTSVWHHFFGLLGMVCCGMFAVRGLLGVRRKRKQGARWREIMWGPDSPVPTFRDLRDLCGMFRWFVGLGPKPRFERWTYWEKFDFWTASLACLLVGLSGLMMWYPNVVCRVISGQTLNVARVVHVELAILIASFLFVFHFYHTHFRPEKFPMDLSALTGVVSEQHLREHRPEYVARLERTGLLDAMRRPAPSRRRRWVSFLAGGLLFSLGLGLLALALVASMAK